MDKRLRIREAHTSTVYLKSYLFLHVLFFNLSQDFLVYNRLPIPMDDKMKTFVQRAIERRSKSAIMQTAIEEEGGQVQGQCFHLSLK